MAKWDARICARTPATAAGRFVCGIPTINLSGATPMTNDTALDVTGILGKLGIAPPGGGLFAGKFPAQPLVPPAEQPAPAVASDLSDLHRVFQTINDNAAILMALGGGMMTGGVGHGFEAAAKMADADRKHQADNANRDATRRALISLGVAPVVAQAAAGNQTLLRSIAGHALTPAQPATSQPAQTMKVRLAGGGDAVVKWDPTSGQYVQVTDAEGI
jgi:hypothetical protein